MKHLPHGDKLMATLCLMTNHALGGQARKMSLRFLTAHAFLMEPLLKLACANLDKYHGIVGMLTKVAIASPDFDAKYRERFCQGSAGDARA